MDVDAYVAVHRPAWARLEQLTRRSSRLRGAELDELVELYQRTATHLSVVRTSSPDPLVVAELTSLVARARSAAAGRRSVSWRPVAVFLARTFPAAAYRARWWWLAAALVTLGIGAAEAAWIIHEPTVRARLLDPAEVRRLVDEDFSSYYRENPSGSFAAQVWTNNAFVAAQSLASGLLLGLPIIYLILTTSLGQLGPAAGYLIANGRAGEFFALILPHGMLELTAVFLAMGAGLRLGWSVIDPGPRTRVRALAEEGRTTLGLALGLALVLLVSGLIEGFVTPTRWNPVLKVGIGAVAEVGFLVYILGLGRRAVRAGFTGDVEEDLRGAAAPAG